jgi:hypothetical protein
MYTTPSYNQHILYGDALHNLKRKNYKTVCAEMSLAKVTLDRMVDFFNGICNFCFICSAARLSALDKYYNSNLNIQIHGNVFTQVQPICDLLSCANGNSFFCTI